jgi:FMN-dependent NADH-azoreductase
MRLLFVNSCIRGKESRTYELCLDYLEKFLKAKADENWTVEEINLEETDIRPLDMDTLIKRDKNLKAGNLDEPMFAWAKQIIEADHIVIGAPYWDLSFPAKLKIYLERCSITGLTFIYSKEGIPTGQCNAKDLVYITTSGSPIGEFNLGYDYIKGLSGLFGIGKTHFISAEALDIIGNDVGQIMAEAKDKITDLVKSI